MNVEFKLRKSLSVVLGLLVGGNVAACASLPGASTVHHLTAPNPTLNSRAFEQTHVVQEGETLYSIAQRYKVDHTALAMVNDVKDGATIRPNQKLRIPRAVSYTHLTLPTKA